MNLAEKKSLSERDICTKYITPALVNAKWDVMSQIREEGYNLDAKNPHAEDDVHRDPAELLAEYQKAQAAVAEVREKLRRELEAALTR